MILLREAILNTTNTVFSRFVISFVAFFFMYFFACCNFCEEDTCHTHITCIFSFCALLVLIMITLRYYRSVRYWMKIYQQEQKNGGDKASNSSDWEPWKINSQSSGFKHEVWVTFEIGTPVEFWLDPAMYCYVPKASANIPLHHPILTSIVTHPSHGHATLKRL